MDGENKLNHLLMLDIESLSLILEDLEELMVLFDFSFFRGRIYSKLKSILKKTK